jgi:hypothetical protein
MSRIGPSAGKSSALEKIHTGLQHGPSAAAKVHAARDVVDRYIARVVRGGVSVHDTGGRLPLPVVTG